MKLPKYTAVSFLVIFATLTLTGCVRRRLTIRTNPPGAMVYVDRQPIGMTPVSTKFTYYGTRHFEIVKDGYRTEKFLRRFNPPWYELPGLAFVSETLWPFEKRDERVVDVQMSPDPIVPVDAVIASGQELRDQARMGVAISAPPPANVIPNATVPVAPPGAFPSAVLPTPSPSDAGGLVLPNDPGVATGFGIQPAAPAEPGFSFPLPQRIPAAEPIPGGAYRPY